MKTYALVQGRAVLELQEHPDDFDPAMLPPTKKLYPLEIAPAPAVSAIAAPADEVDHESRVVRRTWAPRSDMDLDSMKAELKAAIATARYAFETGGITVAGVPIATDRSSQALITGAFNAVSIDPARTFKWKSAAGVFIDLDAAAITAVAQAVADHVEAAFTREAQLHAEVDALPDADAALAYTFSFA